MKKYVKLCGKKGFLLIIRRETFNSLKFLLFFIKIYNLFKFAHIIYFINFLKLNTLNRIIFIRKNE